VTERTLQRRFGEAVRRLRRAKGLSQERLADLCGLHGVYVGVIERGEKNVTIVTADRVATALGVTLWELLREANAERASGSERVR
jgi:XRE family transcriptional regulator, regulator of sulfur utilization